MAAPFQASPSVFTVLQVLPSSPARYCALRLTSLRPAFGPLSKVTLSTLSACCACQYCRATTASPFGIGTTSMTPGRFITDDLSKLATLPPCTGLCLIAAQTISGTVKSRPNTAVPLSFAGTSTRASGLPKSVQSPSDLGFGFAGGVTLAASSATSPNFKLRPVGLCTTLLVAVKHSSAGTPHRLAAATISICRADAPIVRSNSKNPVVLSLLPVNCQLMRGLR